MVEERDYKLERLVIGSADQQADDRLDVFRTSEGFESLSDYDPDLAERLQPRIVELVERFLTRGRLSLGHRADALAQLKIETGTTSEGRVLRIEFPLGSPIHIGDWDGSAEQAETLLESSADLAADDIVWDQDNVGPTGWEAE